MEPNLAILVSDYRFCEYRLRILETEPSANRAAIAAVAARMERLADECNRNPRSRAEAQAT